LGSLYLVMGYIEYLKEKKIKILYEGGQKVLLNEWSLTVWPRVSLHY
jgi:hypothetical protein